MNRHVLGFFLFCLIFKTSIVAMWALSPRPVRVNYEIAPQVSTKTYEPTSCWTQKKFISHEIKNVVVDTKQNKVFANVDLSLNGKADTPQRIWIRLNLFNENGEAVWAESVKFDEPFANGKSTNVTFKKTAVWLEKAADSRYAQIEILTDERLRAENLEFNAELAAPVLIDKGKRK